MKLYDLLVLSSNPLCKVSYICILIKRSILEAIYICLGNFWITKDHEKLMIYMYYYHKNFIDDKFTVLNIIMVNEIKILLTFWTINQFISEMWMLLFFISTGWKIHSLYLINDQVRVHHYYNIFQGIFKEFCWRPTKLNSIPIVSHYPCLS